MGTARLRTLCDMHRHMSLRTPLPSASLLARAGVLQLVVPVLFVNTRAVTLDRPEGPHAVHTVLPGAQYIAA